MKIRNWVNHDPQKNLTYFCFTADGVREVYSANGASLYTMLTKAGAPRCDRQARRTAEARKGAGACPGGTNGPPWL